MPKPPRQKHTTTTCTYFSSKEMMMYFDEEKCLTTWKGVCSDGTRLKSNFVDEYDKIKKNPNFKYFLTDFADLARMDDEWSMCETQEEKDKKFVEVMSSLTSFTNRFLKQIYIRSLPPATADSVEPHRIFPDEALECIPILMKQQGTPIKPDDERLQKYRELWKNPAPHLYMTIDSLKFLAVLEEFDVDKSRIKVIQDPGHELTRLRLMKTGNDQIKTFTPDMKMVLDTSQAVSMVFVGLVCGVNWVKDPCKTHENCLKTLKPRFIALMKEFMVMEKGTYIALPYVISAILQLKRECPETYLTPKPNIPNLLLKEHEPNKDCPMSTYRLVAQHFDLPSYYNFMPRGDKENIPVWIVRVFIMFGWIQQFFEKGEEPELQEVLMNTVLFLAPEKRTRMTEKFIQRVLQRNHAHG